MDDQARKNNNVLLGYGAGRNDDGVFKACRQSRKGAAPLAHGACWSTQRELVQVLWIPTYAVTTVYSWRLSLRWDDGLFLARATARERRPVL